MSRPTTAASPSSSPFSPSPIGSMKQFTFPSHPFPTHPSLSPHPTPTLHPRPSSSSQRSRPSTPSTRPSPSSPSVAPSVSSLNASVERKFLYWKTFWSATHTADSPFPLPPSGLPHEEKTQPSPTPLSDSAKREQLADLIRKMRAARDDPLAYPPRPPTASPDASAQRPRSRREEKEAPVGKVGKGRPASPAVSPAGKGGMAGEGEGGNLSRFWREERGRARHGVGRGGGGGGGAGGGGGGKGGRKLSHLTLPNDPEQARRLWERMKEEMWEHWETVQRRHPDGPPASPTRPHPPTPPPRCTPEDSAADADRERRTQRERERCRSEGHPVSGEAAPRSSYAPPAGRPMSGKGAAAAPTRRYTVSSPIAPNSGASTSFFTSPSSPLPRPSTSKPSPLCSSPASSSPPSSAAALTGWSVRALRSELSRLSLPYADCLEKSDLIARLESHHLALLTQQAAADAQAARDRREDAIARDVDRWATHRPLIDLLNDLNRTHPTLALTPLSSPDDVTRTYKRTLLRVHPDKCGDGDWEKKRRATEIFKVIHAKHRAYVERCAQS